VFFFVLFFFFRSLYLYCMTALYVQLWAASIDGLRPSWQPAIISTLSAIIVLCLIWLINLLCFVTTSCLSKSLANIVVQPVSTVNSM